MVFCGWTCGWLIEFQLFVVIRGGERSDVGAWRVRGREAGNGRKGGLCGAGAEVIWRALGARWQARSTAVALARGGGEGGVKGSPIVDPQKKTEPPIEDTWP